MVVGRLLSYWESSFSGVMLNFGRVIVCLGWWSGFLASPHERDCYAGVRLESHTTNKNHRLAISWCSVLKTSPSKTGCKNFGREKLLYNSYIFLLRDSWATLVNSPQKKTASHPVTRSSPQRVFGRSHLLRCAEQGRKANIGLQQP